MKILNFIDKKAKKITDRLMRTKKSNGKFPSADRDVMEDCVKILLKGKDKK